MLQTTLKCSLSRAFALVALLLLIAADAAAQGSVRGKVLDKGDNAPLEYINIVVRRSGQTAILKNTFTDATGAFALSGLPYGAYTLTASVTGYKTVTRDFTLSAQNKTRSFAAIYLSESSQTLGEAVVTAQRQEVKLEVDRKTFNVDQQIANAGVSASEVLENIPSVQVDSEGNISLRGNTSVEVWINGKASGLTSDNRAEILQQMPAESIERIEVIDNPSAKFSAEGSAGIINIILKKNRRAGYYGSLQAGGTTRGGANTSFNINYNSSLVDAYFSIGYRHRQNVGGGVSEQTYPLAGTYQNYRRRSVNMGNNLFTRGGFTFHLTESDDIGLSGMLMKGKGMSWATTPYRYGTIGAEADTRVMNRLTKTGMGMTMYNVELTYRHQFAENHFLDASASLNRWKSDNDNWYVDSTAYADPNVAPDLSFQYRPMYIRNRNYEAKLDYENRLSESVTLQAGYQYNFSKENTPQESFTDNTTTSGAAATEDVDFFNRFIYELQIHAFYATVNAHFGKLGIMAGLRGEYWKVRTESYDWAQEHDATLRQLPYEKDFFKLFPSLFLSYQIAENDQLQLNYTRRLRRPRGGDLNSFRNTRDATVTSFGNPELTPEFSNSFSLNYLRTWTGHSLLVSAYYRPTSDVIQRLNYQSAADGLMYQTNFNVARSLSTGLELTAKNKITRFLDLSTTANFYYYKLNSYNFLIDGQNVFGAGDHNFTWNGRLQAAFSLPCDISIQATGNYQSRQAITQGYRRAGGSMDLGLRKSFLDKTFVLAVNCRDLFDSRHWKTYTHSDTFTRRQENWRGGRNVMFTLTWNFGNTKQKKNRQNGDGGDEDAGASSGYDSDM